MEETSDPYFEAEAAMAADVFEGGVGTTRDDVYRRYAMDVLNADVITSAVSSSTARRTKNTKGFKVVDLGIYPKDALPESRLIGINSTSLEKSNQGRFEYEIPLNAPGVELYETDVSDTEINPDTVERSLRRKALLRERFGVAKGSNPSRKLYFSRGSQLASTPFATDRYDSSTQRYTIAAKPNSIYTEKHPFFDVSESAADYNEDQGGKTFYPADIKKGELIRQNTIGFAGGLAQSEELKERDGSYYVAYGFRSVPGNKKRYSVARFSAKNPKLKRGSQVGEKRKSEYNVNLARKRSKNL